MAKYSAGQLEYVGDLLDGRDFVSSQGLYYESKAMDNLFQKRVKYTRPIILKNFHGVRKEDIEQTFDYMLLWDTEQYSMGICSWEAAIKNMKIEDADIKTRIDHEDIDFIVRNVSPISKPSILKEINTVIERII